MIMPQPASIPGVVQDRRISQGNTLIPFNHIVLSASGKAAEQLTRLEIGTAVTISQELKHYQADCKSPNPLQWERVYSAIGGSYVFLREGVLQGFKDDLGSVLRTPRTAVAYNDDYVFFIVVDGRDRFQSFGMSIVELGVFAKSMLGAVWGIAMDGGGSSTMVVNGETVNQPNTDVDESGASGSQVQTVERAVANGLLMIALQPADRSSRFRPGDQVAVGNSQGLEIRLGPGDTFAVLSSLLPGSLGVIQDEAELNGILARGVYWWMVDFGSVKGWVDEAGLKPYP